MIPVPVDRRFRVEEGAKVGDDVSLFRWPGAERLPVRIVMVWFYLGL